MALIFGLFSAPSPIFFAVSLATFLFWLNAQFLKKRLFYTFFEILYTIGILAIIYLTTPFYIIPATVWGAIIVASIAFIAWLRAHERLIQTIHSDQTSSLTSQTSQYPKAYSRFIIYYCAWIAGIILIICHPGLWEPAVLFAWTCAMILIGYAHIWPFALHPEWLGYRMRRTVFVSRRRWIARFIIAFLLLALALALVVMIVI